MDVDVATIATLLNALLTELCEDPDVRMRMGSLAERLNAPGASGDDAARLGAAAWLHAMFTHGTSLELTAPRPAP